MELLVRDVHERDARTRDVAGCAGCVRARCSACREWTEGHFDREELRELRRRYGDRWHVGWLRAERGWDTTAGRCGVCDLLVRGVMAAGAAGGG